MWNRWKFPYVPPPPSCFPAIFFAFYRVNAWEIRFEKLYRTLCLNFSPMADRILSRREVLMEHLKYPAIFRGVNFMLKFSLRSDWNSGNIFFGARRAQKSIARSIKNFIVVFSLPLTVIAYTRECVPAENVAAIRNVRERCRAFLFSREDTSHEDNLFRQRNIP